MAHYLTKAHQLEMEKLIDEYMEVSNSGAESNRKSNFIMNKLFGQYFDKLINGVIFNSGHRFWRFGELDDLLQEGRMAILLSLHKRQWDRNRGTIFNFFSTVVSKNLINYTKRLNRKIYEQVTTDVSEIYNDSSIRYTQNFDKNFIIEEAFSALREYFSGKQKFEQLTELLYRYYHLNMGGRFVKKKFIAHAKAYNFSPASVNNYFAYIKRMKLKKEIKHLLDIDDGK